jgi:sulfur dioxygenase
MKVLDNLILFITGNSETLYNSVHNRILSLPPNYTLYPAHDYTGKDM